MWIIVHNRAIVVDFAQSQSPIYRPECAEVSSPHTAIPI